MTAFNPTHRTNRAIGNIKAGTLIRVAQYGSRDYFTGLIMRLGGVANLLDFRYCGEGVQFWDLTDKEATRRYALPGNYVITDGNRFEVAISDSGWDLLPTRKVSDTEKVNISFHETYYSLHGAESGTVLRMTPKDILLLADRIKDLVPEPSPIKDARLIHARFVFAGEYRTLAKFDGHWYDHNGNEYTEEQMLEDYDEIEVIR